MIVLLHEPDPGFAKEASKRGVFAHISDNDVVERHSIDEHSAFELLRQHSRVENRKLIDLATAVVDGRRLLPKQPQGAVPS